MQKLNKFEGGGDAEALAILKQLAEDEAEEIVGMMDDRARADPRITVNPDGTATVTVAVATGELYKEPIDEEPVDAGGAEGAGGAG